MNWEGVKQMRKVFNFVNSTIGRVTLAVTTMFAVLSPAAMSWATASNPTTITDFKSASVNLFTSNVGLIGIGLIALMTAGLALGVGRTFLSKVWGMLVSLGGRNPVGGRRR